MPEGAEGSVKMITRKVRADHGASVVVAGVPMKKAYTREQRQSRVLLSIVGNQSATSAVVTRTRAREIRDALDRVLGDKP